MSEVFDTDGCLGHAQEPLPHRLLRVLPKSVEGKHSEADVSRLGYFLKSHLTTNWFLQRVPANGLPVNNLCMLLG